MPNIGDIIYLSDLLPLFDLLNHNSNYIIGQIIAVPFNSAPSRTLICDGSEISRDTYSELFTAIGTIYGEGDGTTTFNIPDLRDKWIKYYGVENNIGEILEEGLPNITGSLSNTACVRSNKNSVSQSGALTCTITTTSSNIDGARYSWGNLSSISFTASRSNSIYGASSHVTPNSIVLLPCIIYE